MNFFLLFRASLVVLLQKIVWNSSSRSIKQRTYSKYGNNCGKLITFHSFFCMSEKTTKLIVLYYSSLDFFVKKKQNQKEFFPRLNKIYLVKRKNWRLQDKKVFQLLWQIIKWQIFLEKQNKGKTKAFNFVKKYKQFFII